MSARGNNKPSALATFEWFLGIGHFDVEPNSLEFINYSWNEIARILLRRDQVEFPIFLDLHLFVAYYPSGRHAAVKEHRGEKQHEQSTYRVIFHIRSLP